VKKGAPKGHDLSKKNSESKKKATRKYRGGIFYLVEDMGRALKAKGDKGGSTPSLCTAKEQGGSETRYNKICFANKKVANRSPTIKQSKGENPLYTTHPEQ